MAFIEGDPTPQAINFTEGLTPHNTYHYHSPHAPRHHPEHDLQLGGTIKTPAALRMARVVSWIFHKLPGYH